MRHSRPPGDGGSILIMTALVLTVLLGFTALTIDAGYFFEYKQQMGAAADAAAKAGAFEVSRNGSITQSTLETFARYDAAQNGFADGSNGISVTVNRPPASGPLAGNTLFVEVIISQARSTFFANIFGANSWTVVARAVAGLTPSSDCLVVLDPTGSSAYDASSGAVVNLPGCGVTVNSNSSTYALSSTSGASLTATSVSVGGAAPGYSTAAGGSVTVTQAPFTVSLGVPAEADPLGYLLPPTVDSCAAHPVRESRGAGTWTFDPGTYCGGIDIHAGGTLNLNPGTYVINGGQFSVSSGATLNGTGGVTIYNTGGAASVSFSSGARVNLTAPISGDMAGIVLFQDRANAATFSVSSGVQVSLTGAVYFPAALMSFSSGASATTYTFLIANRVSFSSGAHVTLNNDTSSLPGGSPLKSVSIVE